METYRKELLGTENESLHNLENQKQLMFFNPHILYRSSLVA